MKINRREPWSRYCPSAEDESEEICKEEGLDLRGYEAVKHLARDVIREEGLFGVADYENILEISKYEQTP